MVSMHRITAAPVLKEHSATAQAPSSLEKNNRMSQDNQMKKISERDSEASALPSKYAVDRVIDHTERCWNRQHVME